MLQFTKIKGLRERIVRVLLNVAYFSQKTISEAYFFGGGGRYLNGGAGRRGVYPRGHAAGPSVSFSAILDPVEVCVVSAAELWGQISGVGSAIFFS